MNPNSNVEFLDHVKIDAGAELLADDRWSLKFHQGLTAVGTESSPISFGISERSSSDTWNSISVRGNDLLKYNLQHGYESGGSYIKHLSISPTFQGVEILNGHIKYLNLGSAQDVKVS